MLAAKSADFSKRGRPDIIHVCLLQALDSPLNREDRLRIYVHTANDAVINISPKLRIPRNYTRFVGLMEQLLANGQVPFEGEALFWVQKMSFSQILKSIGPSLSIGLSSSGQHVPLLKLGRKLVAEANPAVVVGGFPRGRFSEYLVNEFDELLSIYGEGLEAWTVVTRVLYSLEVASEALADPRDSMK